LTTQLNPRMNHLIRVGALGHVGRFRSADGLRYARGQRVVVRTARGLEVGEVLADEPQSAGDADGPLLRRMTDSDEMLAERLSRNRDAAYEACVRVLAERGSDAVLLDVEHLFDGRGLYFYFLGEVDAATEAISTELAAAYDAEARFGQFADTLEQGCGPGCGTAEAKNGCGTAGGCATCAVASACSR
jgi:hypothetical protein